MSRWSGDQLKMKRETSVVGVNTHRGIIVEDIDGGEKVGWCDVKICLFFCVEILFTIIINNSPFLLSQNPSPHLSSPAHNLQTTQQIQLLLSTLFTATATNTTTTTNNNQQQPTALPTTTPHLPPVTSSARLRERDISINQTVHRQRF